MEESCSCYHMGVIERRDIQSLEERNSENIFEEILILLWNWAREKSR